MPGAHPQRVTRERRHRREPRRVLRLPQAWVDSTGPRGRPARVPRARRPRRARAGDTEGTWNLGIGFFAVVPADQADAAHPSAGRHRDVAGRRRPGGCAPGRPLRAGRQGRRRRRRASRRRVFTAAASAPRLISHPARKRSSNTMCGTSASGQAVNQEIYSAAAAPRAGLDGHRDGGAQRRLPSVQGEGQVREAFRTRDMRASRHDRPRPRALRHEGHRLERGRGAAVLRQRPTASSSSTTATHQRASSRRAVQQGPPAPQHELRHRAARQRARQRAAGIHPVSSSTRRRCSRRSRACTSASKARTRPSR
jgi:hypothetical protein